MKAIRKLFVIFSLLLITGCVTTTYDWQNEVVYIPPIERPMRFYRYNDFWYAEPYVVFIFEDSSGYRTRRKVPTSKLDSHMKRRSPIMRNKRDIGSIKKEIERMKQYPDRRKNKKRTRNRK